MGIVNMLNDLKDLIEEIKYKTELMAFMMNRETATINDKSEFYIVNFEETDFEYPYSTYLVEKEILVVDNGLEKREFLTNTCVMCDSERNFAVGSSDYSKVEELLKKECFFVHSFVRIDKVKMAQILSKISENNSIKQYCTEIYNLKKTARERLTSEFKNNEEKRQKEEYYNDNADAIIKSFIKESK